MDAERAELSSNTASGTISDETMMLEEKAVPIDRLTGVSQSEATPKDVSSETQSDQLKSSKKLVADNSGIEEEMSRIPVSLENDPVATGLETSLKTPDDSTEKPYDVFEAVRFDDEGDDLEQWAK